MSSKFEFLVKKYQIYISCFLKDIDPMFKISKNNLTHTRIFRNFHALFPTFSNSKVSKTSNFQQFKIQNFKVPKNKQMPTSLVHKAE